MRVLAVDLGATSVRVAAVDLSRRPVEPQVVHRWAHRPATAGDGTLRWDWAGIVDNIRRGLDLALAEGAAASIGVDGWGVDYGLLDGGGNLVAPPFSYRDTRTAGWEAVADRIGRARLYASTGIQVMAINTIFQLAVHDPAELEHAERLLMLPDLLVHELTGWVGAERSNASTTGMVNPRTGDWDEDLVASIDLPKEILPDIHAAPGQVGTYLGIPVHLVGSHDTASAFVAMPAAGPGTAFISSGTWVLAGVERAEPDTSDAARQANVSNELGALGGVRFLKNVMGFWMLEQCRARWGSPPISQLVEQAAAVPAGAVPLIDATDERFLSPPDMETEVRQAAGLAPGASQAEVTRCILQSIAVAAADVVTELGSLAGRTITELAVVGGGARMQLLNEMLAEASGLPVRVGASEATALGNALVQGIAIGAFDDLADARAALVG